MCPPHPCPLHPLSPAPERTLVNLLVRVLEYVIRRHQGVTHGSPATPTFVHIQITLPVETGNRDGKGAWSYRTISSIHPHFQPTGSPHVIVEMNVTWLLNCDGTHLNRTELHRVGGTGYRDTLLCPAFPSTVCHLASHWGVKEMSVHSQ